MTNKERILSEPVKREGWERDPAYAWGQHLREQWIAAGKPGGTRGFVPWATPRWTQGNDWLAA